MISMHWTPGKIHAAEQSHIHVLTYSLGNSPYLISLITSISERVKWVELNDGHQPNMPLPCQNSGP